MAIDFLPLLFRQEGWHPVPVVVNTSGGHGRTTRKMVWLAEINIPEQGIGYRADTFFDTQAEAKDFAELLNEGGSSQPSTTQITRLKDRHT